MFYSIVRCAQLYWAEGLQIRIWTFLWIRFSENKINKDWRKIASSHTNVTYRIYHASTLNPPPFNESGPSHEWIWDLPWENPWDLSWMNLGHPLNKSGSFPELILAPPCMNLGSPLNESGTSPNWFWDLPWMNLGPPWMNLGPNPNPNDTIYNIYEWIIELSNLHMEYTYYV